MDPLDYLRLIRRRWWLLAAPVVLAVVVALLTAPSTTQLSAPVTGEFTATHILLPAPEVEEVPDLERVRLFASAGNIPDRAADRLGLEEPGAVLAAQVQIVADSKSGSLSFTSTSRDGEKAASYANALAEETKAFLLRRAQGERRAALAAAQARVDELAQDVRDVQRQLQQGGNADLLKAQLSTRLSRYSAAFSAQLELQDRPPPKADLISLSEAVPVPQLAGDGDAPSAPRGKTTRVLLALVLAVVLGLGAIIVLDRLDTRLRKRDAVEDVTQLPVLAEVPRLPRALRGTGVALVLEPSGGAAEAYRTLRAALQLMPRRAQSGAVTPNGPEDPTVGPQVVLVTSPSAGDGKSTTVANLAAALAEAGRVVVVLDGDLRRPSLHRLLGVEPGLGLSDVVTGLVESLAEVVAPTEVAGVGLVTAGQAPAHPARLVTQLGPVVEQARRLADVVLIDCPPLLTTSDATDLLPLADTVVVVVRAGSTSTAQAERAAEQLARLGIATAGVALVASDSSDTTGSYAYGLGRAGKHAPGAGLVGAALPDSPLRTSTPVTTPAPRTEREDDR